MRISKIHTSGYMRSGVTRGGIALTLCALRQDGRAEMNLARRRFLRLAAAAAWPAVPSIAKAQAYPTRPVRLIVSSAAGGAPDIVARLIAQRLAERLG